MTYFEIVQYVILYVFICLGRFLRHQIDQHIQLEMIQ